MIRRICIAVFVVALLVIGARPVARWYVTSEIEQRSASALNAERFQFDPIKGSLVLDRAEIKPRSERTSSTLGIPYLPGPITSEKVWAKCDLREMLNRRLRFPVAIFDGISVSISSEAMKHIPNIEAVTESKLGKISSDPSNIDQAVVEMDQLFVQKQQMLGLQRAELEKLDRQVAELESQLHRVDNPLRGQQAAKEAESRLVTIDRTINDINSLIEQVSATCRREIEALQSVDGSDEVFGTMEKPSSSDYESTTRRLMEQTLAGAIRELRPGMGLAVRLIEELMNAGRFHSEASRGTDYDFREEPISTLTCDRVQLRGRLKLEQRNYRFVAKTKNIGRDGIDEEQRPTIELDIDAGESDGAFQKHILQGGLSPDSQGFVLRCRATGSDSVEFRADENEIASRFIVDKPVLSVAWLMHRDEWSMDIVLEAEQARMDTVVVDKSSQASNLDSLFDSGNAEWESDSRCIVLQASIRGEVKNGAFHYRFTECRSAAESGLVAELRRQHEKVASDAWTESIRLSLLRWKQALSNRERVWNDEHTKTEQLAAGLQDRTAGCRREVLTILDPRSDLRFTRQPDQESSSGLLR
jgi:hypothetical protein